jgi:transcriptional regulator with XRE-family HTH domain
MRTSKNSKEKSDKKISDYTYLGERIKQLRVMFGERREDIAVFLGITVSQYGLLENKVSATIQRFHSCLNYFIEKYDVNPAWIIVKDNTNIPLKLHQKQELNELLTLINGLLKEQGLMVSLVPKV